MANRVIAVFAGLGIALVAVATAGAVSQTSETATAGQAQVPFAITYRAGPNWRPGVPMREQGLRDHFFYIKRLHTEGRIITAGELGPDGGLILLYARDQVEANGVITADPAVAAGLFIGEAHRFVPRFVGAKSLTSGTH